MILHLMFRSVHSSLVVVLEVSQSALKVQIQQAFETWQPAAQNASTGKCCQYVTFPEHTNGTTWGHGCYRCIRH